jgi:hypothetical protein
MEQPFATCKPSDPPAEVARLLAETGCVVLEQALAPACVNPLADFIYGQVDAHKAVFRKHFGFEWGDAARTDAAIGVDANGAAYQALPGTLKHLVRGELPLEVRLAGELKAVAHEPRLMSVVRKVVDDELVHMHNPPSIRVSFPGVRTGLVPIHQDTGYNQQVAEFVTAWVPLCDIDERCGGIAILPRSHRSRAAEHRQDGVWLRTDKQVREEELVPVYCRKGDAILFGPYLFHGSRPNTSTRIRCSIDYRLFSHRLPSSKHYYDVAARLVKAPAGVVPAPVGSAA